MRRLGDYYGLLAILLIFSIPFLLVSAYSDTTVDIDKTKECTSDGPCTSYLWVYREDVGKSAYVNVTHTGSASGPWTFGLELFNVKNVTVDVMGLYNVENPKGSLFVDQTTVYTVWLGNRVVDDLSVLVNSSTDLTNITLIEVPEPIKAWYNETEISWEYDEPSATLTATYPEAGEGTYTMYFKNVPILPSDPEEERYAMVINVLLLVFLLLFLIFLIWAVREIIRRSERSA